jgi:hypothetical protein
LKDGSYQFVCVRLCHTVLQGPTLLKKLAEAAGKDGLEGVGLSSTKGTARTVVLIHREGLDDSRIAYLGTTLNLRVLCLADIMNASSPIPDRMVR